MGDSSAPTRRLAAPGRDLPQRRTVRWRVMTDSFNTKISALREAARDEAAKLVRLVAEPRGMGDTITRCIERAARRLGWSYRRTEDIGGKKRAGLKLSNSIWLMPQRRRRGLRLGGYRPTHRRAQRVP